MEARNVFALPAATATSTTDFHGSRNIGEAHPDFKAEYQVARSAMFEAGMGRIQALVGLAVDTLEDLLKAKDSPSVRLGAARTVAEIGMHQYEAETIMRKLAAIEAAQRRRR